jgi:hypothetical protein
MLQVDVIVVVAVTVTVEVTVALAVTVIVIVVVTIGLHFNFRAGGWGKERGLYLPLVLCHRTQGVGASFRLEPGNYGVVASCWVCVIFFACVCVGALDSTITSDDSNFL